MADPSPRSFLARFVPGVAGSIGAGLLVFRTSVFDPAHPAFHCVTLGLVFAAVLAAVRISWSGLALIFVVVFGVSRYGFTQSGGWLFGLSGFFLGAGLYLIALIYDLLAQRGVHLGKFLIMGPLLGGLLLGLAPMVEFHTLTSNGVMRTLMLQVLIGLLVGDGVGLGVEISELFSEAADRVGAAREHRAP